MTILRPRDQFGSAPWGTFAHGDPGPAVELMSPGVGEPVRRLTPIVMRIVGRKARAVRLLATYTAQATETIWNGSAFVSPFSRHSTYTPDDEGDGATWTILRSAGWPVTGAAQIAIVEPVDGGEIGRLSVSFGATAA